MSKKIILYIFIVFVVLIGILVFSYIFKDNIVFTMMGENKEPEKAQTYIHLYGDESAKIDDVLVRVYYVETKDNENRIEDWQQVFSLVMKKVTAFFELQFGYNMNMDFLIYPQVIYTEQSSNEIARLIENDYKEEIKNEHSESLSIKTIVEVTEQTVNNQGAWALSSKTIGNAYVVNLFIASVNFEDIGIENMQILGLNDESNNSLVFSSGFINENSADFYESVVSHEIGHGLGIPRFYSYTSDVVHSSGMMGGGLTRKIQDNYLNQKIKQKMIK